MKIVKIEDIENSSDKSLNVEFEDYIPVIPTKGKIEANLELKSLGDFIRVQGDISGVAILECDLCLEKYEYGFDIEIDELFAKNSLLDENIEGGQEIELKEGQFVTDLEGAEELDIQDLLYQSVILDFPNKKVCGINCKGGEIFIREENPAENEIDPRMSVFKNIKIENK